MITLFNGHGLAVKDRFQAEKLGVQLSERQSTATITLNDSAPVISVDDWVAWEDGPGAGTVWRVKTIEEQYDRKTRTVTVEHMILALKDRLMFGETKPSDMGGGSECTAEQAARYILGRQGDWTLGGISYAQSEPYNFNGDDLYSALETVSKSLEDSIWEYDFTQYPFRLYIRKLNSTVASEMRADRNIRTLKKTIDRSRMYTRMYPIGKNNIHISGDYVGKNENLYGIICRTETDQSQDTEQKLRNWAQRRLNRHCEPSVTVSISGLELAEATGEALDHFTIGRMCRVPLPEFSTTITERVTKLNYTDIIADPMSVTVTLANEREDVASIINQLNATAGSGGSGGRASAKQKEEDHAWFVDTTDHVAMVAEAVAGEGADQDWSRVAEVMVDGEGIHQRVVRTENDIVTAESKIEVLEDQINLKVSKGNLISEINMEPGRIRISANKINLDGYVTASQLDAQKARIDTIVSGRMSGTQLTVAKVTCAAFRLTGSEISTKTATISGTTIHYLGW